MRTLPVLATLLFPFLGHDTVCGAEPSAPPAAPREKTVAAAVTVPGGTWKGIRLEKLGAGVALEIRIDSDGRISAALHDAESFASLPGPGSPLVQGTTSDTLGLATSVPRADDWFLVLDNRDGREPRNVSLEITARAPAASGRPDLRTALDLFETAMAATFVTDRLDVDVVGCEGSRNAFAAPGRILLCRAFVDGLVEDLDGDSVRVSAVLLYTLMHEAAHVLLHEWDLPMDTNEDTADEMATVMLLMFGQPERVEAAADYFERLAARGDSSAGGRHSAPAGRAGNLRRWLADESVARRWQAWLVPRMTTATLRQLAHAPRTWTDRERVESELASRAD